MFPREDMNFIPLYADGNLPPVIIIPALSLFSLTKHVKDGVQEILSVRKTTILFPERTFEKR